MSTYVYIAAPLHGDGLIKVGMSDDPYRRLNDLQSGSPVELRIVEVYGFDTRYEAAILERSFHLAHADARRHGEWFDVDVDEADFWLFHESVGPDIDRMSSL